jgi:hypothetical protein
MARPALAPVPALPPVAVTGYGALRPLEMYHLAPIEARDAIAHSGLDFHSSSQWSHLHPHQPRDRGNYLWANYPATLRYREFWAGRHFDLYKVDATGLNLHPDPLGAAGAFFTTEQILPDRLARVVLAPPAIPNRASTPGV